MRAFAIAALATIAAPAFAQEAQEAQEGADDIVVDEGPADSGDTADYGGGDAGKKPAGDTGSNETSAPESYLVRPGDTLWNLSQRFLNNPWYWPRIWSYNQQLDNPNWIYPGSQIRFYPGTDVPITTPPAEVDDMATVLLAADATVDDSAPAAVATVTVTVISVLVPATSRTAPSPASLGSSW